VGVEGGRKMLERMLYSQEHERFAPRGVRGKTGRRKLREKRGAPAQAAGWPSSSRCQSFYLKRSNRMLSGKKGKKREIEVKSQHAPE